MIQDQDRYRIIAFEPSNIIMEGGVELIGKVDSGICMWLRSVAFFTSQVLQSPLVKVVLMLGAVFFCDVSIRISSKKWLNLYFRNIINWRVKQTNWL